MNDENKSEHVSSRQKVNPLLIPLLSAIEIGLNELLALDPESFAKLSRFKGKIVALELTDLNLTLYLFPDADGIQLMSHYEGEADTHIRGTLLAFTRMGLSNERDKTASVFNGEVVISGNIGLGQHFQALFEQLDIDWEDHLSRLAGDVVAHAIGNFSRGLFSFGKKTLDTFVLNTGEYIQYETRDVASGPEVQGFIHDIDELRSSVDRAEARINRLLQQLQ